MPELPWIFTRLEARSLIDIVAVSMIIYWLLSVAQGTRATQLIRGLVTLIVASLVVSNIFDLTALNWLLSRAWPALVVAIPIIFQPELRRALEQLGHTGEWLRTPFATHAESEMERTVDEISRAASHLSRIRYGALLVIERETGLQDYADRGVPLDATVTRQLLINIFFPNSPLHDGAVIVRNDRILAASCVLPLSDREIVDGKMGTRHRAAIGITEESDALAVVVSEETGAISLAHSGRLITGLDQERLRRSLRSLLKLDREGDSPTPKSGSRNGRRRELEPNADRPASDDRNAAPRREAALTHD
ncbi:MAG: TIGR00159 family protein [Chloroflexi bacterium]|nr:MAG: TIGR00159 family protein [Chloroflexota bacterium]